MNAYKLMWNGIAERVIYTIKSSFNKTKQASGGEWDDILPWTTYGYRQRRMCRSSTSLFELFYGVSPQTTLEERFYFDGDSPRWSFWGRITSGLKRTGETKWTWPYSSLIDQYKIPCLRHLSRSQGTVPEPFRQVAGGPIPIYGSFKVIRAQSLRYTLLCRFGRRNREEVDSRHLSLFHVYKKDS